MAKRIHDVRIAPSRPEDDRFVERALGDVLAAIDMVGWPPGEPTLTIYAQSGKKRGEGNGVGPLKDGFLSLLAERGWDIADRSNPYRVDAVLREGERWFGVEWETGNISSSHRAVNRILRAVIEQRTGDEVCVGGCLVLPTKNLAQYLTDRVGNWEELEPYFKVWERVTTSPKWPGGHFSAHGFEHDHASLDVPRMAKGTDGRSAN